MQLICIHCGSEKKELEFVPRSVTCIDCFNKFFLQIVAERVPTQEEITKAEQIQEKRRAYHREYAKNNRGKMSEIYTRYYHNNKQKILARRRTPKQKRKEKYYASMASHYLHDSYIAGLL